MDSGLVCLYAMQELLIKVIESSYVGLFSGFILYFNPCSQ